MAKIIYLYTLFVKGDFHKIFRQGWGQAAVPPLPWPGVARPSRFSPADAGGWESVAL